MDSFGLAVVLFLLSTAALGAIEDPMQGIPLMAALWALFWMILTQEADDG